MKFKLLLLAGLSTAALAHEGATGVIKERMDAMSAIGDANKSLTAISRGRADFDLSTVQASAQTIAEHSGQSLLDLFPEGSLDDSSDAKAEIWQDWENFAQYSLDLNSASLTLAEISDEAQFSDLYDDVSKTCGGCHRSYRARR